jgi:hypothetical protein
METADVRILVGHWPGERAGASASTVAAEGRPEVLPELLVPDVGRVQVALWPLFGAAWPPPGGSSDPTSPALGQALRHLNWPRADLYIQWGAEYRPLPLEVLDEDIVARVALQIGDWNVAGRLLTLLERTPEWPLLCDEPGLPVLRAAGLAEVRTHLPGGRRYRH